MCVFLCLCLFHTIFGYHRKCDRLLPLCRLVFRPKSGKLNSILSMPSHVQNYRPWLVPWPQLLALMHKKTTSSYSERLVFQRNGWLRFLRVGNCLWIKINRDRKLSSPSYRVSLTNWEIFTYCLLMRQGSTMSGHNWPVCPLYSYN
jgi:hypothetical protein